MPKKGQSRSPQEVLKHKITMSRRTMERHLRNYNVERERLEGLREELRTLEKDND